MTRYINMAPTWGALMPALIACLQNGTGDGPAMAAEELCRLAREVDSANAAASDGAAESVAEERNRFGLESVALGRERAATDLAGAARDFMAEGAYIRAACYWEAAARIAPAGKEEAHDFRVYADLAERKAAGLLTRAHDLARKEALADTAATLAAAALDAEEGGSHARAAGLYAAAALACPHSIHADSWGAESRDCQEATQSTLAAAIKAAFSEGRREAREQSRDSIREALKTAESCLAAFPPADLKSPRGAATLRAAQDLRETLEALAAALPEAVGAF